MEWPRCVCLLMVSSPGFLRPNLRMDQLGFPSLRSSSWLRLPSADALCEPGAEHRRASGPVWRLSVRHVVAFLFSSYPDRSKRRSSLILFAKYSRCFQVWQKLVQPTPSSFEFKAHAMPSLGLLRRIRRDLGATPLQVTFLDVSL